MTRQQLEINRLKGELAKAERKANLDMYAIQQIVDTTVKALHPTLTDLLNQDGSTWGASTTPRLDASSIPTSEATKHEPFSEEAPSFYNYNKTEDDIAGQPESPNICEPPLNEKATASSPKQSSIKELSPPCEKPEDNSTD